MEQHNKNMYDGYSQTEKGKTEFEPTPQIRTKQNTLLVNFLKWEST